LNDDGNKFFGLYVIKLSIKNFKFKIGKK